MTDASSFGVATLHGEDKDEDVGAHEALLNKEQTVALATFLNKWGKEYYIELRDGWLRLFPLQNQEIRLEEGMKFFYMAVEDLDECDRDPKELVREAP